MYSLQQQQQECPASSQNSSLTSATTTVVPAADESIFGAVSTAQRHQRFYVVNKQKPVCQQVQRYLLSMGAQVFDPFNVVLLRALNQIDCRILLHSSDVKTVHLVPNLLRLKRDLRVSFVTFNSLDDVAQQNLTTVFPRGGLVVMDSATLIGCRPDILSMMCEYMLKQRSEKSTSWLLILSLAVISDLQQLSANCSYDEAEDYTKLCEIIAKFRSLGVIEVLSESLCRRRRLSTFDYQLCCVTLQAQHLSQYRHFLFVTDVARTHPSAKGFVESGVDVMSVAEFMRGFVGSSVAVTTSRQQLPAADAMLPLYADGRLSNSCESLMNKWVLPMAIVR
jgi:hypothetical protein